MRVYIISGLTECLAYAQTDSIIQSLSQKMLFLKLFGRIDITRSNSAPPEAAQRGQGDGNAGTTASDATAAAVSRADAEKGVGKGDAAKGVGKGDDLTNTADEQATKGVGKGLAKGKSVH